MKQQLLAPGEASLRSSNAPGHKHWKFVHSDHRLYITALKDATMTAPIPKLHLLEKPEEYSVEDEERLKIRRLRNRSAAAKCRMKKKAREVYLAEEAERLRELNEKLNEQLKELRDEKERLDFVLRSHSLSCGLNPFTALSQMASVTERQLDQHRDLMIRSSQTPSRTAPQSLGRAASLVS